VAATSRLLVVADDLQFGRWLLHRIEALRSDLTVDAELTEAFERRLALSGPSDHDALLVVLQYAATESTALTGTAWLAKLREFPDMPAVFVIAQDGDELTAVQAMRLGVADYLPRRLLTPELLAAGVEAALEQQSSRQRRPEAAASAIQPVLNALRVPRDLIPRYTLLDSLGESARATVYLASSAALNRNVALKVSQIAENEEPQFSREYAAIGAMRHPSIVDIYDYGVVDGREYIAMEYFPCGDLKARLQNPISEDESVDYLRRIAAALSVVHSAGILHRDLKPPNIMLREDGQVVLIDFGLAKSLDNGTRSTAAGILRGSPYYMSPEQAQGMELDERSDLYSMGVVFFEMLTGNKPYLGATAIEVLQQHVAAPVPELPEELSQHQFILDRLMAKSRDERVSSADDLLACLAQAAA
jgi:eukaryotic-like serine/threonine-protein kinase